MHDRHGHRAPAQSTAAPAEGWSWAQLRAAPGVDSTQVAWLEANVPRPEATDLFAMLGTLSKGDAVQMLPSLAFLEGSFNATVTNGSSEALLSPSIVTWVRR